ncbi:SIMPL domain-containing protein [Gayadomonas joobiniege]|uniref:SIMPL domain-containing protein n=1 Tax=Gayadomonas joobiniege TaxID=1234606 RepID=UPI0012DF54FD|nr:SIMPL domain-containing protein [Gayadomonas joobiniege]
MKIILLALSLIASSALASVIPNEAHIYVEGSSEFSIYPDQIKTSIFLASVNHDAEIAKADVDQRSLKLFEALKEINVESGDITATPLQINPAFEYQDGKKIDTGTKVSRNVDIRLKNLKKYPQLNDLLVKAGITSKVSSVVEVLNERELKKKALKLALKDARSKAETLAELQNKTIKDVHSISEFDTRDDNSYTLRPDQNIYGQSYAAAEQRRRVPPPSPVFEIGEMRVTAKVYVVYTIK